MHSRQRIQLHICGCCGLWCWNYGFHCAFGNGHSTCIAVPANIIAKAFCQISCRSIDTAVNADSSHVHSFCFVHTLQVLIFITLGVQCEFYDFITISEIRLIQGRIPVYFQTHCFRDRAQRNQCTAILNERLCICPYYFFVFYVYIDISSKSCCADTNGKQCCHCN